MKRFNPLFFSVALAAVAVCLHVALARADVAVQCPEDTDGDGIPDIDLPHVTCRHLAAGDGFILMADGRTMYVFGFGDVSDVPVDRVMDRGMLGAEFPAPTLVLKEGDDFYLTLTNVGMMMRPDLFDPHTVHFHGFPEAASVFDGVPEASIAINMGSSLTYYYHVVVPGTYMYHCHAEATEHMQMGMLGNVYITPAQNDLPDGYDLKGFTHRKGYKYAYNDGDGSTYYDVEYAIQVGSFDPDFHDANLAVQPLPFAAMRDKYPMLNGRGYPDTVKTEPIANNINGRYSQPVSSLIRAHRGQHILLRLSNLNVTRYYSLSVGGIPMQVIAKDAKLLQTSDGRPMYYYTTTVTMGGGESIDVILDTSQVEPGTYVMYVTQLQYLSNNLEDYGGMMTEIVIE